MIYDCNVLFRFCGGRGEICLVASVTGFWRQFGLQKWIFFNSWRLKFAVFDVLSKTAADTLKKATPTIDNANNPHSDYHRRQHWLQVFTTKCAKKKLFPSPNKHHR